MPLRLERGPSFLRSAFVMRKSTLPSPTAAAALAAARAISGCRKAFISSSERATRLGASMEASRAGSTQSRARAAPQGPVAASRERAVCAARCSCAAALWAARTRRRDASAPAPLDPLSAPWPLCSTPRQSQACAQSRSAEAREPALTSGWLHNSSATAETLSALPPLAPTATPAPADVVVVATIACTAAATHEAAGSLAPPGPDSLTAPPAPPSASRDEALKSRERALAAASWSADAAHR